MQDTSQVIGSALTYSEVYKDELALQVAAVTKLTRNLFLAAVIPGLAFVHARGAGTTAASGQGGGFVAGVKKYVPVFVGGFVGMAMLRSVGDAMLANSGQALGLFDASQWKSLVQFTGKEVGLRFCPRGPRCTARAALALP